MAGDTYYQFTEGSGRKARSAQRIVNGDTVDVPYQVADEPPLPAATAVAGAVSTATADSHLMEVMAGSSSHVIVRRILVTQLGAASSTTACRLQLHRLTTAGTGGTAVTPNPYVVGTTIGATAMTLPTTKGTEGVVMLEAAGVLWNAAPAGGDAVVLDLDFARDRTQGLWIPAGAGNGLAIQNVTAVAGATVCVTVELSEAAFAS